MCVLSISTVALMLLPICSEDEEEITTSSARHNLANGSSQSYVRVNTRGHLQRIISIEEDPLPSLLQNGSVAQTPLQECSEEEEEEASANEENIDLVMSDILGASSAQQQKTKEHVEERETPTSPRGQPVGKETSITVSMWTSIHSSQATGRRPVTTLIMFTAVKALLTNIGLFIPQALFILCYRASCFPRRKAVLRRPTASSRSSWLGTPVWERRPFSGDFVMIASTLALLPLWVRTEYSRHTLVSGAMATLCRIYIFKLLSLKLLEDYMLL